MKKIILTAIVLYFGAEGMAPMEEKLFDPQANSQTIQNTPTIEATTNIEDVRKLFAQLNISNPPQSVQTAQTGKSALIRRRNRFRKDYHLSEYQKRLRDWEKSILLTLPSTQSLKNIAVASQIRTRKRSNSF